MSKPSVTDDARAEWIAALERECIQADAAMQKWVRVPVKAVRAALAAGRAETVGNDGLTDTERQEYARQYRTGPAFTATLMARRGGKTQALIESLLAQAKDRDLTVEVVYPETTTATVEDAARAITAMGGPWADRTPLSIAKALADAGLLATARAETTTEWGVRFYGRGPFDMPCEGRDDAEAEVDQVDDKHAPAVLIRREVTAWTEADRG